MGFLLNFYQKSLKITCRSSPRLALETREEHYLHCMAKPEFVQGSNQGKSGTLQVLTDLETEGVFVSEGNFISSERRKEGPAPAHSAWHFAWFVV